MSKGVKILVILMFSVIVIYVVVGIYTKNKNGISNNNIPSGDIDISGNVSSGEEYNKITYEINSGENMVSLTGTSESSISTTTFNFENDKLISIILTEEIISGDDALVENIYEYMKNDEEMSQVYSSIERNGNIITAILKDEYVEIYGDAGKIDIYEEVKNSIDVSK